MNEYWSQWSYAELMSMHGVEIDECDEKECYHDGCDRFNDHLYDREYVEENPDACRGCWGRGCVSCLL